MDRITAKDDEEASVVGVLGICDLDGNPEIPISRADEAENCGLKLLASKILNSESLTLGAALITTHQLLLQFYGGRDRKELLTCLKWLIRNQVQ